MRKPVFAVALLLCLVCSSNAFGQSTNATVGGTVSDATGALIPGVAVKATNNGTGIVNETITNETGTYNFPTLQPGTYTLAAELSGFQTQSFSNVTLGLAQQVRLNFSLQVGSVGTTVDVNIANDTTLATTSNSIGTVLPEFQLRELPTGDRNVMELLRGVGGTGPTEGVIDGYFGGQSTDMVNITRDGFSVQAGRYDQGTFATSYTSSDLVEEVKITTGTVDAEANRGSGQVAMVTRSGTNQFRGSAFWNNKNSALTAANWFDNFNGIEDQTWENRNQFGVRLGGPIIRNKTFFFFLIDEQRYVRKENFLGTVYTQEARNGIFRYFPGADNRNAQQTNPTVDKAGNPVRPSAASGPLTSINLFNVNDPRRSAYDPSGYIQQTLLARMPLPNDFTTGDGLNTAGIRFVRRYYGLDVNTGETYDTNNRDQINVRLDHNFNSANKLSFVGTYEYSLNYTTTGGIQQWPNGYDGAIRKRPQIYSVSLVSTIGNKVNELRWGYRGHDIAQWAPWYVLREKGDGEGKTDSAKEAFNLLPKYNGIPLQVVPQTFSQGFMNFGAGFGSTRGSWSPLKTWADSLSWIQGKHAFKAGFEWRQDGTDGWNDNNFTPMANIGPGGFPSPIDTTTFPNLGTNNSTLARNIIYNLSGSINDIRQGFDLVSKDPPYTFKGYQDGVKLKVRKWEANEISMFFKDDWKISTNLTLNLGLKWEWYGVPYSTNGIAGRVVNGYQGLCGIGCGALTNVELVGKNSPQPDKQLFNDDWNNFGPSIGFSLQLPQLGGSTVLRAGYGVNYSGNQFDGVMGGGGLDAGGGTLPGLAGISGGSGLTYSPGTAYWNLANAPLPFTPQFQPFTPVPLDDPRALTMNIYEPNRVVPVIQNMNLSIQRELGANFLLDVAYAGSRSTKLWGNINQNYVKIFENGFLEAFNETRAGRNAPLFDRMLMGLNFGGNIGTVNGTTVTGSQALRLYTNTRANIANGNVGAVASFINTNTSITGKGGGFIRNCRCLPEDYMVFNPQFASAGVNGNPGSSWYHSLELKMTKRLSFGLSNQTTYTWSKVLETGAAGSRDPRNRNADKAITSFDRRHVFASNGTYALPFGTGRPFLTAAPGWAQKIVGEWQLGALFRVSSGAPLTLSSGLSTIDGGNATPHLLGELPKGEITFNADGSLPNFFATTRQTTSANDPTRALVTSVNTLNTAYSNRAILDANGNVLLINPQPGDPGTLGLRTVTGPGRWELDANLVKRIGIDDTRNMEFRADIVNVLNHATFSSPNVQINSASWGQISSTSNQSRRFTIGARLNF